MSASIRVVADMNPLALAVGLEQHLIEVTLPFDDSIERTEICTNEIRCLAFGVLRCCYTADCPVELRASIPGRNCYWLSEVLPGWLQNMNRQECKVGSCLGCRSVVDTVLSSCIRVDQLFECEVVRESHTCMLLGINHRVLYIGERLSPLSFFISFRK